MKPKNATKKIEQLLRDVRFFVIESYNKIIESVKKFDSWIVLTFLLTIIGFGGIFFPWIILTSLVGKDYGVLGDFVNGISAPAFSLVIIILVYRIYILQKKELNETSGALTNQ